MSFKHGTLAAFLLAACSLFFFFGRGTAFKIGSSPGKLRHSIIRSNGLFKNRFCAVQDGDSANCKGRNVFFFPGQGAQFGGMANPTAESTSAARSLYERASEILGYDLLDTCVNAPKSLLDQTKVCQPAIFVCSMAAVENLRATHGDEEVGTSMHENSFFFGSLLDHFPVTAAGAFILFQDVASITESTIGKANSAGLALGLSLGEYSALCYAGAISFEDGVKITKVRGEAMQKAADLSKGGMVSVIGLKVPEVQAICKRASQNSGGCINIANYLCPGNIAVSGDIEACQALESLVKAEHKLGRAIKLSVAGAFHTDKMLPAVKSLKEILQDTEVKTPRIPVLFNVDADMHSDPDEIRKLLARQVVSPVLWEDSVRKAIGSDFRKGYEFGPGTVLSGILKRIDSTKKLEHIP